MLHEDVAVETGRAIRGRAIRVRAMLKVWAAFAVVLAVLPSGVHAAASTSSSHRLTVGHIQTYATAGCPFQASPLPSGGALVSLTSQKNCPGIPGIDVFRRSANTLKSSCVVPQPFSFVPAGPAQTTFYNNGANFAVADGGAGALFYRTGPLLACLNAAKTVSQTATQFSNETPGTISLAVTPDGKHALIANEYGLTTSITSQGQSFNTSGSIGVVGLHAAFTQPAPVFAQLLVGGNALAGLLLSKSGRTLYVTSEVSWPTTAAAGSANPFLASGTCVQAAGAPPQANGLLTVIDVAQLEIDAAAAVAATPAANTPFTPVLVDQAILKTISVPFSTLFATTAIRATIDAGCSPVRMAETGNARPTLWVTARGDNRVLAFDTALLESETSADTQGRALIGAASSGGTAPVGLALFGRGQYLAVANSNRFQPNAPGNVALLKLTADAHGNYAATVVETLDTDGMFPREINVGADDATLYVTNFLSQDFLVIPTKLK